jgi:GTP-binding protein HflX
MTTTQVLLSQGHATLETMTTAQNRALLDDAADETTGSYALEERGALRRVAGLSTELTVFT